MSKTVVRVEDITKKYLLYNNKKDRFIETFHLSKKKMCIRDSNNPNIVIPYVDENAKHVYHQYTIRVLNEKRDELIKLFEENGVGYGIFYPFSIPEQPCYKGLGFKTEYEITDKIKKEVLSIPVHPGLSMEEIATVAAVINQL